MRIRVVKPGLLTTVQAEPRPGMRYLGVPSGGAADPLSLALANKLVGNDPLAPALEVTLTGPLLQFEGNTQFAVTGALANAMLNDSPVGFHETLNANDGDMLHISAIEAGSRIYIAFAGGLIADVVLGSASTYLPAAFGGHKGRALAADDVLQIAGTSGVIAKRQTPDNFRPRIANRWALRTCHSAETDRLEDDQRSALFETHWQVGRRADRMGIALEGVFLEVDSGGRMPSSPVFPGTIQCPENGAPFLLSADAQTTGGYPRIAQIARVDRHLLGQLRPGDRVQLLPRRPQDAIVELRAKHAYWREWLPGIEQIV